jgi:hypothetical protein
VPPYLAYPKIFKELIENYFFPITFYSATKRNEILLFVGKWMILENIILSEVSQVQKAKSSYLPLYVEHRPDTNTAIS